MDEAVVQLGEWTLRTVHARLEVQEAGDFGTQLPVNVLVVVENYPKNKLLIII